MRLETEDGVWIDTSKITALYQVGSSAVVEFGNSKQSFTLLTQPKLNRDDIECIVRILYESGNNTPAVMSFKNFTTDFRRYSHE